MRPRSCQSRSASWASIARRVGRHPTTVAREAGLGGGRGAYRPAASQRRLEEPGPLRGRAARELRLGRSPEAVRADLVAEGAAQPPAAESI